MKAPRARLLRRRGFQKKSRYRKDLFAGRAQPFAAGTSNPEGTRREVAVAAVPPGEGGAILFR